MSDTLKTYSLEEAFKIEQMIMARRLGYDPRIEQQGLQEEVARQKEFESLVQAF